jgi:hypothetical protein
MIPKDILLEIFDFLSLLDPYQDLVHLGAGRAAVGVAPPCACLSKMAERYSSVTKASGPANNHL